MTPRRQVPGPVPAHARPGQQDRLVIDRVLQPHLVDDGRQLVGILRPAGPVRLGRIRAMRRHHHPRHREPSLDLVRQTAPRGAGGMTAAFTPAVQVDDHRPAPVSGSLAGNPQDIVQAWPRGVHDPLTFQLDFATGNASAARQEIIINRRLVSGQFPGALPPSPALRATPVRVGTPIAPGHRTRVRPVAPETVVRFTRHGLKSLAFKPKGQALAAASSRPIALCSPATKRTC